MTSPRAACTAIAVVLASLLVAPVASADCGAKDLVKAARAARPARSVQSEHIVTGSGNGVAFAAAPIDGIESVPALDLPDGVDLAFLTLDHDSTDPGSLPSGAYTLRASASEAEVLAVHALPPGSSPPPGNASVEVLDARGQVVRTVPASLQQVSSLTPPPDASRAGNFLDEALEVVSAPGSTQREIRIRIWVECSNGFRVCVDFVIRL